MKMKKIYILITLVFSVYSYSQNTIGILRNDAGSYNGYTLFTPNATKNTFLINNCGEIVQQWTSNFNPGNSVYLLENGNLLRTGKIANPDITFGGVGGKIELFDWDNNLLWEYTYSSNTVSQHHDIYPLPNGNVLMLAVSTISEADALFAGRDPSLINEGKIFNEQIIELEPILGTDQANIAWSWNIQDHLIQDFDNTKANFGVVADNPQLLDFNFLHSGSGGANWLHFNSIQYNSDLDQIVISSRILSEIFIIDHSTTMAESASHSGGLYGKGGDFLYRWGNPEAYDHGTVDDRTLYGQHYPHFIESGLIDAGKIILFNNGRPGLISSVDIFNPPMSSPGVYIYDAVDGYGPIDVEYSYTTPTPTDLYSPILSSGQRLPNGNTLICDGDSGYFLEIDTNDEIVWEYINPDTGAGPLTQGDTPPTFNLVFRAEKYAPDYAAFIGRDLTPGNPIEINPDLSECTLLSIAENELVALTLYPNPTQDILNIQYAAIVDKIEIHDMLGKLVATKFDSKHIDLSELNTGIYIAKIYANNKIASKKIVKH